MPCHTGEELLAEPLGHLGNTRLVAPLGEGAPREAMTLRFADHVLADARFGGKAAGLARLAMLGARVPPFFAVEPTTSAPEAWPLETRAEFLRRAAEILSRGRAVMRSSALGEDGNAKSFAGLFETVLGVSDPQAAIAAAARCIASGNGARATSYAGTSGPIPVGLVCQLQVEARSAGVCFTRDPSGRDAAIVIEAVPGLGDRLVSGAAEPERWRVYRNGFGGWEARRDRSGMAAISAEEAILAAREAAEIAARFGHPLDMEWARDAGGTLWWLQARPITAGAAPRPFLVERSCPERDDGPVTIWSNWNLRETMPDPLTPLSWTIWRDVFLRLMVRATLDPPNGSPLYRQLLVLDQVEGRAYWNMNALLAVPGLGAFMKRSLSMIDQQAGRAMQPLFDAGLVRPSRLPGPRLSLLGTVLAAQWKGLVQAFEALSPKRLSRRLEAFGEAQRSRAARAVTTLSDVELVEEIHHLDGPAGKPFVGVMTAMGVSMGFYGWALHAFRHAPPAARLLVAGLTANPTTRISIELDDLTESARPLASRFSEGSAREVLTRLAGDEAGQGWLAELRAFLDRFGQRCPKEFDFSVPRWIEDPTMIVDLVRAGLRAPTGERVRTRLARLYEERRRAIEAAAAAAPWWKRPLLRWLARKVEEHIPLRESPKHHLMRAFLRIRHATAELGRRFAARGVVASADDVYFLELPEVEAIARGDAPPANLRARIVERRERLARFEREPAPDCIRSDGVPVADDAPVSSDPSILRGTPVSGGRATGRARLMRVPEPTRLEEGDILVVEFADPGWTPIFPRVRGMVMEVGGLMCHAACVARELGIPSVFGIRGAMRAIQDGDTITVDGDHGTVKIEHP